MWYPKYSAERLIAADKGTNAKRQKAPKSSVTWINAITYHKSMDKATPAPYLCFINQPKKITIMSKVKWSIDPNHSEVTFKVKHLMISTVTGHFNKFNLDVVTEGDDFGTASE